MEIKMIEINGWKRNFADHNYERILKVLDDEISTFTAYQYSKIGPVLPKQISQIQVVHYYDSKVGFEFIDSTQSQQLITMSSEDAVKFLEEMKIYDPSIPNEIVEELKAIARLIKPLAFVDKADASTMPVSKYLAKPMVEKVSTTTAAP
jgi:hypothetical protein